MSKARRTLVSAASMLLRPCFSTCYTHHHHKRDLHHFKRTRLFPKNIRGTLELLASLSRTLIAELEKQHHETIGRQPTVGRHPTNCIMKGGASWRFSTLMSCA